MFLRVFCQVAAAIQEQGESAMAPGGIWQQAAGQFNGEQLAYVAAFATGSQLLFGDRPKATTYKRLFAIPSLADLDAAFGAEAAALYSGYLAAAAADGGGDAAAAAAAVAADYQAALSQTCVWGIMMREREGVMLGVVDQCCRGLMQLPGAPAPAVALVVGSAHLPGLQELWDSGAWRDMVGPDGLGPASPVLAAPALDASSMGAPGAGAKRGLLEAVLQLSVPAEVLQDVEEVLPPVPDDQAEARAWAWEIYGSFRMQLAALPEPLLSGVCGAVRGSSAAEFLAPLRALRPLAGGPGWDAEAGAALRTLNFDLSGGAEQSGSGAEPSGAAAEAA
ncbi:hypothetical protein HT031_003733 [Scenedesmus sp. PABB004]|nr:hypothetical protein HT031_003733 [Scenedesmus sp. PABB004]